jgi:hypothetical protein
MTNELKPNEPYHADTLIAANNIVHDRVSRLIQKCNIALMTPYMTSGIYNTNHTHSCVYACGGVGTEYVFCHSISSCLDYTGGHMCKMYVAMSMI